MRQTRLQIIQRLGHVAEFKDNETGTHVLRMAHYTKILALEYGYSEPAEILGDCDSELMKLARSVALTHHEKWDGSGNPEGLAGEDIPIEWRIVALGDVFDVLTSRRPYEEPWPVEDAVKYITSQSGRHFDPILVDIMTQSMDKMLAIREQWQD